MKILTTGGKGYLCSNLCNAIPDEILTDHPDRIRGMIIESANPAHSLADSAKFRDALTALDTLVVIDVAMTETAQLAACGLSVREIRSNLLQL